MDGLEQNSQTDIKEEIEAHLKAVKAISDNDISMLLSVSRDMVNCLREGSAIYWCGNGGSAADAQHLSAELVGRFKEDRSPLRSHTLATDASVITSIANDYAFEEVYARQVVSLKARDLLVLISTSGNSMNLVRAAEVARDLDIGTIALLGNDGGSLKRLVRKSLIVQSQDTARIQEVHILWGHIICGLVEKSLK